jgi:hypothetical protein
MGLRQGYGYGQGDRIILKYYSSCRTASAIWPSPRLCTRGVEPQCALRELTGSSKGGIVTVPWLYHGSSARSTPPQC